MKALGFCFVYVCGVHINVGYYQPLQMEELIPYQYAESKHQTLKTWVTKQARGQYAATILLIGSSTDSWGLWGS